MDLFVHRVGRAGGIDADLVRGDLQDGLQVLHGVPALRKRGELDKLPELAAFADKLEKATIQTIEDGVMTGDLYLISKLENKKKVNSKEFLEAIRERLDALMA